MTTPLFKSVAVSMTLVSSVIAACNRTALLEFADTYVLALEKGQPSYLTNLADNFTYIENDKPREIDSGILSKALQIDHRHTIADTTACATYTELIITHDAVGNPTPFVIGAQFRHSSSTSPSSSTLECHLADIIISSPGSWLFNATQTLYWTSRENWGPLTPPSPTTSPEKLRAAADAYLDMWSVEGAVDAVPWGTPCARLEGGVYTGKGEADDSCKPGIPTNHTQRPNSNRRYVVDEMYGAVEVLCVFEHLGNAPDSHEFRLEGGRLRYVHTITVTGGEYGREIRL